MKKFWTSKKFWPAPRPKYWLWGLILLALFGIGLFVFFTLSPTKIWWGVPQEIKRIEEAEKIIQLPVSSVYRYDFAKREYFPDKGKSWQNSNFLRYVYDLAPEGLEIEKCYYFLYDNLKKEVSGGGQRKCNANLTIGVGEGRDCSSQGENACTLYVYGEDSSGNQGEMTTVTYHIDWQRPKVGKAFQKKEPTYQAKVSDNLEVGYCWFYLDGENRGSMKIEPFPCQENRKCIASIDYSIGGDGEATFWLRCADHYAPERESYLNLASGESGEIVIAVNHPPKISSCRVTPTQGTTQTDFRFEAAAVDPDEDILSYSWDFGDGEVSNEKNPIHYYLSTGTYEPKVIVSDGKGEEVRCSTAWAVVVEE